MYNRYIPQPDGSYRKNRIPDPPRPQPQRPPAPPPEPCREPEPEHPKDNPCSPPHRPCQQRQQRIPSRQEPEQNVTSFLKRLLPRDFDTGDLIVVLLLLLMAGDCSEDQNTALLTLILYLYL
ncbi:MAG: hypothetical protein IJV82_03285 [Oscillospiraceae bacterium]|nr:hypothetical protein [Oscillospiraceae bacterium]